METFDVKRALGGGGNGVKPSNSGYSEGDNYSIPEESHKREAIEVSCHTDEQHLQNPTSSPQRGEEAILSEQERTLGVQVRGMNKKNNKQLITDWIVSHSLTMTKNFTNNAIFRVAQDGENSSYLRHTEEQHLPSAECWLKTQAVCRTFQPNVDTFNANVVIGKRKYPVTNSKELSCKKYNYIEINNQLDCFGSKEPHNDDTKSVILSDSERSHQREDFANNAILWGLNNCSPQNDGKNYVAHWKNFRKIAFTLAEILITLGIIGVVAAITLPSIIQNYREKEYATKLKRFYSEMENAHRLVIEEYGTIDTWGLTHSFGEDANTTQEEMDNKYKSIDLFWSRYMKYLGGEKTPPTKMSIYGMDKKSVLTSYSGRHGWYALKDGIVVRTTWLWPDKVCSSYCGDFSVDLDGDKGPNSVGRDIFFFSITNKGIKPLGLPSDVTGRTFPNSCQKDNVGAYNGYGCTAWVIYNENMDYLHCNGLSWEGKTKCKN